MEIISSIKPSQSKYVNYLILLKNGETIQVVSETFECLPNDEGDPFCYRFFCDKKIVLEIEGGKIDAVLSENHVDTKSAIAAIKKSKPKVKKKVV